MFKPADILSIGDQLVQEGVGIFPFDTLLGITGVVSESVIQRIQYMKNRQDQPFILILPEWDQLTDWVAPLSIQQERILKYYWPAPITFIFKKHDRVPDYVTCSKSTIAIRMVEFLPVNFLLEYLKKPVLSTSVNITGEPSCMTVADCPDTIVSQMDFVLDSCKSLYHQPSTIVDLSSEEPICLRQGVIPYETI